MTVMDVGANIGYLTLFFCRAVGAQGAVFAFEPEPDNFSDLARAVENNQISCCKTINYACGAYDKEASLASGLNGYIQMEGLGARKCQMVALDSFVIQQNIARVDVVKIDVEGFESDVLRGMEQIIQRDHPVVYVEVHPPGFCGNGDPRRVCSFLKEHYKNLVAFRIWSDVKQKLPFWQRVRASYRSDYPVQHFCETTLDEVMNTKENRYQVLALPQPDENCSRT
jgi:FkbM family methyltransferase